MPAAGGAVENLTPNLQASAYWLSWRPDSKSILFVEAVDGGSGVAEVSATAGAQKSASLEGCGDADGAREHLARTYRSLGTAVRPR